MHLRVFSRNKGLFVTSSDTSHLPDTWAKQALDRLKVDGLDPHPDNFAVYYAYYSGTDPNLKMAMDLLLDKFGSISQQQCNELYQNYLGLEAEHRVLQQTHASIDTELKRVMGVLDLGTAEASKYNNSLNSFTNIFTPGATEEDIRHALKRIAQETSVMVDQNKRLQLQLAKSTEQLTEVRFSLDLAKKDSLIDPLTEVGNRKYFNNELARATEEALQTKGVLSLLMIDIDHFKKFNDTFGHLIGDQVLKLVARTLVENLKGRDVIARYGGEEFVILLPQTHVADAEKVANQLRGVLATKQIQRKKTGETLGIVTISIGATEYYPYDDLESFIARADGALYQAKQTGRNKVMVSSLSPEEIVDLAASRHDNKEE